MRMKYGRRRLKAGTVVNFKLSPESAAALEYLRKLIMAHVTPDNRPTLSELIRIAIEEAAQSRGWKADAPIPVPGIQPAAADDGGSGGVVS